MRRISSSVTTFQQLYPPVAVVVLSLLWFFLAALTHSTPIWIAAVFIAVAVTLVLRFAPKVRHITLDGNCILVSSPFRTLRLSLSSVVSVTERRGGYPLATIEFDHNTPFGRHVHFIPKVRYARIGRFRWRRVAPDVENLAQEVNSTTRRRSTTSSS